jgi:hypothetical protein
MKRLFLTIFILLLSIPAMISRANPVVWAPLVISELHFDASGNWTIELSVVQDPMIQGDSTLNSFRIITKTTTALFNTGILIHWGDILLVTESDFQSPLTINPADELIQLEQNLQGVGWSHFGFDLMIGSSTSGNCVPPVNFGQSVHYFSVSNPPYNNWNFYAKSDISSLGEPGNPLFCKGWVQGVVVDENLDPVDDIPLRISCEQVAGMGYNCTFINDDGTFNLLTYSRNVTFLVTDSLGLIVFGDTIVPVEPDSGNMVEITLDTLFTGINPVNAPESFSLKVTPNPMVDLSTITIDNPSAISQNAIIKIYNEIKEIEGIIPVNNYYNDKQGISIPFSSQRYNLVPGIYFLLLEVDSSIKNVTKIIVTQ